MHTPSSPVRTTTPTRPAPGPTRPLLWAAFTALGLLLGACGSTGQAPPATAASAPLSPAVASFPTAGPTTHQAPLPGASPQALQRARELGRGINFGNIFDAPREGDWGLRADDHLIALVGEGGFTRGVRLPVRWSNHASADAAAVIDPAFFARVDGVVDALLARGATVMLNMHHYRQLDGDPLDPNERAVDPSVVQLRFLNLWRQIAERYAGRSERLVFELYNEPHGVLEPHWNELLSRAVRVVRERNPERVLVIGPTLWNSATRLPQLVLPPDPHLILTVHHYEPFDFTHQGAEWVQPVKPLGVTCCSPAQTAQMDELLDLAAAHGRRLGYPVVVGEFGAYSKADAASRVRYSRHMRDAIERRGMTWMYWELASGFGVYDPVRRQFRPDLFDALYGP